jgi:hypothetical protein
MVEVSPAYLPDHAEFSAKKVQLLKKRGEDLGRDANNAAKTREVVLRGIALECWDVRFPLENDVSPYKT